MIRKPFAAFGRVLYANYYEAGYTVDAITSADSKTVLMFSEGDFTVRDKNTGELVEQCGPGWIRYGNYENQVVVATANTDSVSWCYDPKANQDYIPEITLFKLNQGESVTLVANKNLFLCKGTLLVNGNQYIGPYQIVVKTEGNTALAVTDVYGLLFK
jgi:hypothetical protein